MAWPMLFHSIRSWLLGLVLATVIPLVTVIGVGLGSQFRDDQNEAMERALDEAKLLAAQVDDHVSKISTRLADTNANDALLRQVKEELPDYVSSILLFAPDGSNIGVSGTGDQRINAGGRAYFQEVLAGQRLAIGDVVHTKLSQQWGVTVASPVKGQSGRLRAGLGRGPHPPRFPNALRIQHLPAGSIVRIVNHSGIVVASSDNPSLWIGRDLKSAQDVAQALAAEESSGVIRWPDQIERITGSASVHRAPWVVSVGLPMNFGAGAMTTHLTWGGSFIAVSLLAGFAIAWMLSGRIVGPLRQLQRDALALARGNLTHRTTVKTNDEFGNLSEAFNRMAASIERRQFELQESKNTLAAVIDASPVLRQRKDGALVHVKVAAAPMYSPEGAIRGVAWAHQDITERKKVQAQLERLAHFDPLTGLPNRLSLQKALSRLLAGKGAKRPISVALFDLDNF